MTKYFTFLIATIIALLSPLHAQPAEHISFVHIGVNEGLSQNTIFDITQDKQGNMWFATHDGLNKYDGYDFTVYQHDEQNPYSIGSDITRACMSDSQGNIWIGTQEGLSLYDATQDKFYNYTYPKNKANTPINGMVEINENQLLLFAGKDENLLRFDTGTRRFSDTPLHPSLLSISPTAISRQGDNIYIGSYEGMFVYSISRNTLENVLPEKLKGKQILYFTAIPGLPMGGHRRKRIIQNQSPDKRSNQLYSHPRKERKYQFQLYPFTDTRLAKCFVDRHYQLSEYL